MNPESLLYVSHHGLGGVLMRSANFRKYVALALALLVVCMAFFLLGCSRQGGPLAGGSSAGRADSADLSRDEKGPEGGEGSYSLVVCKEYSYGFSPG